jgi:hypothetical protein
LIEASGDTLFDALMRSGLVVVVDEPGNEAVQVVAAKNEHMIQAFPSEGADEPLAISIGSWGSKRCLQFLDTATGSDFREAVAVLTVAIVNEVLDSGENEQLEHGTPPE